MEMEPPASQKTMNFLSYVAIILGIVVMTVALVSVQRSILREDRDKMMVIAKSTAKSVENYVDGAISSIVLRQRSWQFWQAVDQFLNNGDNGQLLSILHSSVSGDETAVTDICLLDGDDRNLLCTVTDEDYVRLDEGGNDVGKMRVYRNEAGKLFLGILTTEGGSFRLLNLLSVERMYHATASFATLGQNGYVMIKHSGGLILMHPVAHQIGSHVLSGRRERFPDLDYTDLERLIENQSRGEESVEVYHSYWWAGDPPPKVKKISAYTPARIQDDFLIISAVADYEDVLRPIQVSSAAMFGAAILVTLGVMGLLMQGRREKQRQVRRENEYLRQLNRSMEEMNRRQEEMQHNQRLQMIGTLTGGIAHEFRNLLTPIMGYSGLLRETLPPDSPMRADIDEIYTSAVRAKEIIKQITSLSRKNLDPVFKPLPLDDILPRILKVVATMKPAGAEMHVDVDFDGHRIMGNATQINQVILNLCNNAFQALPDDGGALWVSGRIEEDEGARFAVLRFRDNGAGMDAKVRDRIFDPFFTTKRVGEGTGLGLSVVQNIVDLHQGAIEVDSEPGRGTTFTLRFPTVRPNEIDGELEEPEARPLREPLDIVLVEDDSHVLRVFQRGLEQNGFTVKAFTEPLEALRELEQNSCDLLVTDYNMPRMTGAELAMRARGLAKKPKILVLTGFADKEMLEFLRQDIIDGYQIKPVEISELVEKINTLFA